VGKAYWALIACRHSLFNSTNSISDFNKNVKKSLDVDGKGNKLSEQQQEYLKNSKVRDENGNLLIVYHGTRKGNFTVFN
jgi:hypothetical protein